LPAFGYHHAVFKSKGRCVQPRPDPIRRDRLNAAWTFFRHWLKAPLTTASVVPSGEELAARMADQIRPEDRFIVELGPGTGALTGALLRRVPLGADFAAVELNGDFATALRLRYPDLQILQGDATHLARLLSEGGHAGREVDLVISGLGILIMPDQVARAILRAIVEVLAPDGRLIQFTYRPRSPIPRSHLDEFGLTARRVSTAWRNLPPAFVYEYRRR
jgi:phospholipid N-methyltransferase